MFRCFYRVLRQGHPNNKSLGPLIDKYKECAPGEKGGQRRPQRLPIIEISRDADETDYKFPEEVIEVSGPAWDIFQFWHKKIEKIPLKGWHQVGLKDDLSNIDELEKKLDEVNYLGVTSAE